MDHFYPNILAGYDEFHGVPGYTIGDPREALGTLWYHDHTLDFTSPNVYRGMAGFYLLFDDLDSGDEHDPNPQALRLPSSPYDYQFIFQDKRFDANGVLTFDQFTPEGVPGDKMSVNGKIEPVLHVARRKYRLRFLNGGPTRFYEFYLVNTGGTASYTFTYIANDGNLLPAPMTDYKVRIGVAERADIVVDCGGFPLGTEFCLINRLEQPDNRISIPPHERGRKDVYVLGPAESVKVFLRFRDFKGKYPMHCHNLVHEDHTMMVRWDIVD